MKVTSDSITLRISDIADSISAAIHAACAESDYLSTGTVGPAFSCSGPGIGWQKNYDASDYAARALSGECGAVGYVDADDGRLATLDDDGDVVWSDESVVELIAPDADEVDGDLSTAKIMVEALANGHCIEGEGDWDQVRALVEVSESDALAKYDMEIVADSIIYHDDGTGMWYRNDRSDLLALRELMGSSDEDISRDAYSHWCAGNPSEGEYETQDKAREAAEEAAQ